MLNFKRFVSGTPASTLRELYALAATQQPLASFVSQQRLLEISRLRQYDLAQHVLNHQQGAVTKLLGRSLLLLCVELPPDTISNPPPIMKEPFKATHFINSLNPDLSKKYKNPRPMKTIFFNLHVQTY